ncbi:tripartite motif-containing protein 35-like [Cynoglossus semilaevis]|uniref:Tripartite motif-containing protein 35-like n=1 Tax=Cynoglossus semilaevis TaxID=244447 RepID=A0A3P8VX70_CYNSE|nr:tripartite motif-containing protein 35-like [Cynoglossus semilaevis]
MFSVSDENLSCPVCHDIFNDPVVLLCSHSFCRVCLSNWWKGKSVFECPCCKTKSPNNNPPRNLALKNLCEAALQDKEQRSSTGSEVLCSLHSEKLRLFCLDHKEAVCLICRDSRRHTNHRFRPIDEAANEQREELQKFLKPLQGKLVFYKELKENCAQLAKHVKVQARHTEKVIKEQFQKIQQFLKKEEQARLAAVREEGEQKSQMINEKIEALNKQIAALSQTITATENELEAGDAALLLNYKATVKRVTQRDLKDDPELVSGTLIDVPKHLGNLTFNIWLKMKEMVSYIPVILDPNTADPELIVSEDLSGVRSGRRQPLPRNPERTKFSCCILGSQGFSSGSHSWDVEVGDNKDWELGVLGEYIQINERIQPGLWRLLFSNGKLSAFSTSGSDEEVLLKTLQRVRVHLDFDQQKLSFLDLSTNKVIHTFKHTFTDTLFPYIYTENHPLLKILPAKVNVTLEKETYE